MATASLYSLADELGAEASDVAAVAAAASGGAAEAESTGETGPAVVHEVSVVHRPRAAEDRLRWVC